MADSPVLRNLSPFSRLAEVPRSSGRRPGRPDGLGHLVVADDGAADSTDDGALALRASRALLVPGPAAKDDDGLPWDIRPGEHTLAVDVTVPDALAAAPADRLRLSVHGVVDGQRRLLAESLRAPREVGRYRLRVTFTVPEDLTRIWFGLVAGSDGTGPAVEVGRLALTEGRARVPWFDGDTPADQWYDHAWAGEPQASGAVRTPRDPAESLAEVPAELRAARLAEEVRTRLEQDLPAEAAWLAGHLPADDPQLVEVVGLLLAEDRELRAGPPPGAEVDGDEPWSAVLARDYDDRLVEAAGPPRQASAAVNGLVGMRLSRHFNAKRVKRAVPRLRTALEGDPDPRLGYALGWSLGQTEGADAANPEIDAAAARDTGLPFDVAEAAQEHRGRMHARREVARFLAPRLDTIRQRAEAATALAIGDLGPRPLFMYWGQGFDQAPALVRACRDALLEHHPAREVHLLDDGLLPAYTEIPDHVLAINPAHRAAFSDALRLDLLVRHGGCWLDATCFTTGPVGPAAAELAGDGDFFAFRRTQHRPASWFLAARPSSYVVRTLRAAFYLWWEERDDLIDYYLVHHCFEMLCRLDDRFREEWAAVPSTHARPGHRLQRVMLEPTPDDEVAEIVRGSVVHKLTTGFDPLEVSPGVPLGALLRGSLPGLG